MRVIVAGAGPSGASAAIELARGGIDVELLEKSAWPRDKTCGDAISPLGIREGAALGVAIEGALHLRSALITTPRERAFRGGWPLQTPWGTTIERRIFDAQLVEAAVAAGATFTPRTRVRSLQSSTSGIVALLDAGGMQRELRADAAIVGDGAAGDLAGHLGFAPHRSRLVALRGYAEAIDTIEPEYGLFYDRGLAPGYGWLFPMDGKRVNVGILVDEPTLKRRGGNPRDVLDAWIAQNRHARSTLGNAPQLNDLKGGIIPTGRARTGHRVFLVGDAAGVADPFTAEGIYQAMASGRLAARALIETQNVAAAATRYERACAPFDANERTARWLARTFTASIEICAARANARPAFADHLNTAVFFPKKSMLSFVAALARSWYRAPREGVAERNERAAKTAS